MSDPLTDAIRFGESPRWRDGRLWFSDVHDYALKAVALDGTVETIAEVPGRPAGLGFMPDGRVLLATALDRKLCWVAPSGELTVAADLEGLAEGPLNDMVVDGRGRAYVGDVGFNMAAGEAPRPGRVILFTVDETPRVVADDMMFPNGCAVSADGARYVVAETFADRISEFAVAADGTLTDRRVLAQLDGPPDGLCLDAGGGVWVAQPNSGRYLHLGPSGEIDRELASEAPFAVTCVLGGPDRATLFLSSAYTDLQRLGAGDTTGRIDAVAVDVPGAGWP
jgi:sugar lactone lactonase YvrE